MQRKYIGDLRVEFARARTKTQYDLCCWNLQVNLFREMSKILVSMTKHPNWVTRESVNYDIRNQLCQMVSFLNASNFPFDVMESTFCPSTEWLGFPFSEFSYI